MEQLNLLGGFEELERSAPSVSWNLWHGCRKISPGCQHCYVYRSDARYGRDSSQVEKNASFDLPIRRNRRGDFVVPSGKLVYTCFTSDFFLEEADPWRPLAWDMIRQRPDLRFFFITKRIHRFYNCIPSDWGEGYPNVAIGCTVENQDRAAFRLPIFRAVPIQSKTIICEPLLEDLDLRTWLGSWAKELVAGGESGLQVRPCDYQWILSLRQQCVEAGVAFSFKQTGAYFIKEGRQYHIPRKYQHQQARKAGLNYTPQEVR